MTGIVSSILLIVIALIGFATVFGATRLRDRLVEVAGLALLVLLALPVIIGSGNVLVHSFNAQGRTPSIGIDSVAIAAVVVGHAALGIELWRRRARVPERQREIDRARTRMRTRVPVVPEHEEGPP